MKQYLAALGGIVVIAGAARYIFQPHYAADKGGFPNINYGEMCFAGECIPYEGDHVYNKQRIDKEIAVTMLNEAQFVIYHRREPLFFPLMKKKLKEAGLPEDLIYLAVAESSLISTAVSPSGAAGIWQFMPATARDYGLIVNDEVDERFHLEKATDAAIEYLTKLYKEFDNWSLAAAAYNRGENGLTRDLDRQDVDSYYDVHLNPETARYVYRIIAIKYMMENRYDFFDKASLGEQYRLPKTKSINVGALDDVAQRARKQESNYRHMRELNLWVRKNTLPKGNREIKLYK